MTLTEFLNARYDEDKAVARAAGGSPWKAFPRWVAGESNNAGIRREDGIPVAGHSWPREMGHIARFDPTRVLADIAAKRAILRWLDQIDQEAQQEGLERYWLAGDFDTTPARRMLAQPYAEHPDFDPAWRM